MSRPAIARATARLPRDDTGPPGTLEMPDGQVFSLEDDAFARYLLSAQPFTLVCSFGNALVIPEKRTGSRKRYWIARAYSAGVRAFAYVGEHPTGDSLRAASGILEVKMAESPATQLPDAPAKPPSISARLLVAAELLEETESDTRKREAAADLRELARALA